MPWYLWLLTGLVVGTVRGYLLLALALTGLVVGTACGHLLHALALAARNGEW